MLMHITAEDCKQPKRIVAPIDPSVKEQATNLKLFTPKTYDIILEVGMGICLPQLSTKYKIKVKIGDAFEWTSETPKEPKVGYNRWSERCEQTSF